MHEMALAAFMFGALAMNEEPTTAIIQRYLDALPGDTAAEPFAREAPDDVIRDSRLLSHRMFSGWEIGRWNPPNATLVPSWRGRPSPTGLDRTTASKLLPGCGLVLRRGATRGTTTGWREVSEPPGTIGRSLWYLIYPVEWNICQRDDPARRHGGPRE